MLPDFPKQKKILAEFYLQVLQGSYASASVALQCPRMIIHEGRKDRIVREDGTEKETDFERIEAAMEIPLDEFSTLTPPKLVEEYKQLGQRMAIEQMKVFIKTLDQACDESGQKVDGGGRSFCIELWMEALEKMELSFKEDGELEVPFFLINPSMAEQLKAEVERLEHEPELKRRYEELVVRKRSQWRDREASRKLAG